ncbi:MAG: hypothetical protein QM756_21100 [Polyangiaceae bacterium]
MREWRRPRIAAALTCASLASAFAAQAEPARLVSPFEGPEVNTLGVEGDGTRRTVSHGLRALVHPDGSVAVAREVFPLARGVQLVELPRRFGQGFLFATAGSGRTLLWLAKGFTDTLTPFASLDFESERIVAGFDRIYVQARRSGDWVALDAESGAGIDRGSLPRSPSYGSLAFADAWFGAVELPIRGVVVSFDAGGSWQALGPKCKLVGEDGGELVLAAPDGRKKLSSDGTLRAVDSSTGDPPPAPRAARAEGPAGANPLANAVLRGISDAEGSAVVLYRGSLTRVRTSDGHVLASRARLVAPSANCSALKLGKGLGFVCQEQRGKTQIFAFKPPLSLELVQSFDAPRAVLVGGTGALSIRGGCAPENVEALHPDRYCVRSVAGQTFEISTRPHEGQARVVARSDGSAAVIVPPQGDKLGALVRVESSGKQSVLPLVLDDRDEALRALLRKGFWLDAWVENDKGELAGWVTGQTSFTGVHVARDGHVRGGVLRRRVERALFSGERLLLIAAAGVAEQSVDGGRTFTDVDLPPELTLEPAKLQALGSGSELGCSTLGCAFGGWLRMGWDAAGGGNPLPVAAMPKPTSLPQPGGGRWLLRCAPTGEASAPALPVPTAPGGESESAPWAPFWEQAAPARPRDALAFDTSADAELRAYLWAPRGADFGRAGRFSVTVLDAHRVRDGVWRTLPSQSPWSDATQVAETFGFEGSAPSAWHVSLDASGRAGVLSVSARGGTELFAVAENRGVVPLLNASRQGVGTLASVVEMESGFVVAAQEDPRTLRVFALENGDARLIGQYADLAQGRGVAPVLVRSTRRDALAIWTRGPGWYVFPLDVRTGAVGNAIEVSARTLSRFPRPCEPDEDGYLLEGPVGIEPYAEFLDSADRVVANGFVGRFVVSDRGVCVSSLAARSEEPIDRKLSLRTKSSKPDTFGFRWRLATAPKKGAGGAFVAPTRAQIAASEGRAPRASKPRRGISPVGERLTRATRSERAELAS